MRFRAARGRRAARAPAVRRRPVGDRGLFAALAAAIFVARRDRAPTTRSDVEASGPDGPAGDLACGPRSARISLPRPATSSPLRSRARASSGSGATSTRTGPSPTTSWWCRSTRPFLHARLDRRRAPLVGSGPERQVRRRARRRAIDLVQGRRGGRLTTAPAYTFSGASYAAMRTRVHVVERARVPGLARAQQADAGGSPEARREPSARTARAPTGESHEQTDARWPRSARSWSPTDRCRRARAGSRCALSGDHKDSRSPLHRRVAQLPGARAGRAPADPPAAGRARERPDRAGHLQPGCSRSGSATLVVLFAVPARDRPLHLRRAAPDRRPLRSPSRGSRRSRSGSTSSAGPLLYVSFAYTPPEAGFNSLPPLSDTVFISNNGVDVWITAVGLTALGTHPAQSINLGDDRASSGRPGWLGGGSPPSHSRARSAAGSLIVAGPAMLAALLDAGDRPQLSEASSSTPARAARRSTGST